MFTIIQDFTIQLGQLCCQQYSVTFRGIFQMFLSQQQLYLGKLLNLRLIKALQQINQMGQNLKGLLQRAKQGKLSSDDKEISNKAIYLQKRAKGIQKQIDEFSSLKEKVGPAAHSVIIELTHHSSDDSEWENQFQVQRVIREYIDSRFVQTVKILFEEEARAQIAINDHETASWYQKLFPGANKGTFTYLRYYVLVSRDRDLEQSDPDQIILYGFSISVLKEDDIPIRQRISIEEFAKNLVERQKNQYKLQGLD